MPEHRGLTGASLHAPGAHTHVAADITDLPTPGGGGSSAFVGAKALLDGWVYITNDDNAYAINWPVNEYDTSAIHSTTISNNQFVASLTGYWQVTGSVYLGGQTTGLTAGALRKNGVDYQYLWLAQNATPYVLVTFAHQLYLSLGDYVDLTVINNAPDGSIALQTPFTTFSLNLLGT